MAKPNPLPYESKPDFKRRNRWFILTENRREVIRFSLWMAGLFAAGVIFAWLMALLRYLLS